MVQTSRRIPPLLPAVVLMMRPQKPNMSGPELLGSQLMIQILQKLALNLKSESYTSYTPTGTDS